MGIRLTYSFRGGSIESLLRDAVHAINLFSLGSLSWSVAGEEFDDLLVLGRDLVL